MSRTLADLFADQFDEAFGGYDPSNIPDEVYNETQKTYKALSGHTPVVKHRCPECQQLVGECSCEPNPECSEDS